MYGPRVGLTTGAVWRALCRRELNAVRRDSAAALGVAALHAKSAAEVERNLRHKLARYSPCLLVFVWPSQPEMLGRASARLRQLFPQQAGSTSPGHKLSSYKFF